MTMDEDVLRKVRISLMDNPDIASKFSGVFTEVTPQTSYPYITLGYVGEAEGPIYQCTTLNVAIWSVYRGLKEVIEHFHRVVNIMESAHFWKWGKGVQACLRLGKPTLKSHTGSIRSIDMVFQIFISKTVTE